MRWGCVVIVVALLVAACGDADEVRTADAGSWTQERLGPPGEDSSFRLARHDDVLVVVATAPDGSLRAWSSDDGGALRPADVPGRSGGQLQVQGLAAGPEGFAVVGTTTDLVPFAATSPDGRAWSAVDGFDEPADALGVVALDDGFLVTGAFRRGPDPSSPTFEAASWLVRDGEAMAREIEGGIHVGAVRRHGDDLVALGSDAGEAAVLWRSGDEGRSWTATPVPPDVQWSGAATLGDALVLVGSTLGDGDPMHVPAISRSTDGGRTWSAVDVPATIEGDPWLVGDGGSALGITSSPAQWGAAHDERCYRDIAACRTPRPMALHLTDDGESWRQVDTAPLGDQPWLRIDDLDRRGDELVVLGVADGVTVWTWAGPGAPPAPAAPLPTDDDPLPPLAPLDDPLPPGATHRFPLGTHCGIGAMHVGGSAWRLVERPQGGDADSGSGIEPPPTWPHAGGVLYGFVTLGDDDRLRYSIDAGGTDVIAVYERWSPPEGSGCA